MPGWPLRRKVAKGRPSDRLDESSQIMNKINTDIEQITSNLDSVSPFAKNPSKDPKNPLVDTEIPSKDPENHSQQSGEIDPALVLVFEVASKDRQLLVKIEQELTLPNQLKYELKHLNSFQRFLVHKIADYHELEHVVDKERACLVLSKTPGMQLKPLLSNMFEVKPEEPRIKIMKRDVPSTPTKSPSRKIKNSPKIPLKEREERYLEARARIVGDEDLDEPYPTGFNPYLMYPYYYSPPIPVYFPPPSSSADQEDTITWPPLSPVAQKKG
jgi:hypothetical protein